MKIKFGVRLPVSGPLAAPEAILKVGTKAEELGFDAITTHDHVCHDYETRYHNAGGVAEMVDERDKKGLPVINVYETMVTFSVLAGQTKNVRLIPCALAIPWRHPVLFAKQAMTLQQLSGGRFVSCVCIGNIESDFRAMGVDFHKRGKIFDEYLEVLHLILSGDGKEKTTYEGDFVHLPPSEFYPKPAKKIPIWIAGQFNEKVFSRIARFGDGFLPVGSPQVIQAGLAELHKFMEAQGRKPESLEVGTQTFMCLMNDGDEARKRAHHTIESFYHGKEYDVPDPANPKRTRRDAMMAASLNNSLVGSPDDVTKRIESYVSAGIRFFDIRQINRTTDDVMAQLELFAKKVMPSFD